MANWIFKIAKQELYRDVLGEKYVYDNTHSVRVKDGDVFLYLDKSIGYAFSATGIVRRLSKRKPTQQEAQRTRTQKIRTVFTAHLSDIIWFKRPISISPTTKAGKRNRAMLGIVDANVLGWSQSIPSLGEPMYQAILNLAESNALIPLAKKEDVEEFFVSDAWGNTKKRKAMTRFSDAVMRRSDSTCIVCGTKQSGVVDAAHLSPYAFDQHNRANPANGVCLCAFCHRALDRRIIAIHPGGDLLVCPSVTDPIAKEHFTRLQAETRKAWLSGVSPEFLELTVRWFNEAMSNTSISD
jgi:hypothetical protein